MKTSYFAKSGKHPNAVSIALWPPKWFKGRLYPKLAPTKNLLQAYKNKKITEIQYGMGYVLYVLDKLNPKEVFKELGKDVILLCYEKPEDFCHREIVANWFKIHLGIKVEEL